MQSEVMGSLAVRGAGVIDYSGLEETLPFGRKSRRGCEFNQESGAIIGPFIYPIPVWVCCSQYASPLDIALRNLMQPINSELGEENE